MAAGDDNARQEKSGQARAERLAEALRANLARRKAQARARREDGRPGMPPAENKVVGDEPSRGG